MITVAIDKSADDARPWIEAARPTHPSLIDTTHALADRYNIVNVPTILWIDERGRIDAAERRRVRDRYVQAHHRHGVGRPPRGAPRLGAREATALPEARVRALQTLPTDDDQRARAEFGLGEWLFTQGRTAAAARHFAKAGELAPHDFTIRRGTMPMRGIDPMGPQFREMLGAWVKAGNPYYRPLVE